MFDAGEPEVAEVAREERQRSHVIDRDREEALNLTGVEIHRQDAVGSRQLEHVGDEARRDRLARLRLAVLARVREERHHGGDALCGRELRGLDHEHELHQVRVDRDAAGLHEEHVGAADRLLVAAVRLAVLERVERRRRRARRRAAAAIALARSGWERPAKTMSRFCGPRSIQCPWVGCVTVVFSSPGSASSAVRLSMLVVDPPFLGFLARREPGKRAREGHHR